MAKKHFILVKVTIFSSTNSIFVDTLLLFKERIHWFTHTSSVGELSRQLQKNISHRETNTWKSLQISHDFEKKRCKTCKYRNFQKRFFPFSCQAFSPLTTDIVRFNLEKANLLLNFKAVKTYDFYMKSENEFHKHMHANFRQSNSDFKQLNCLFIFYL